MASIGSIGSDCGALTVVAGGRDLSAARREIDAEGLLVTPGFVDVHTHYDGQATWDPELAPSCWHGVTTVVMGNCGVGFAPASPDKHDWLIGLMEGVEDIPGSALAEGSEWEWGTFPEYRAARARNTSAPTASSKRKMPRAPSTRSASPSQLQVAPTVSVCGAAPLSPSVSVCDQEMTNVPR